VRTGRQSGMSVAEGARLPGQPHGIVSSTSARVPGSGLWQGPRPHAAPAWRGARAPAGGRVWRGPWARPVQALPSRQASAPIWQRAWRPVWPPASPRAWRPPCALAWPAPWPLAPSPRASLLLLSWPGSCSRESPRNGGYTRSVHGVFNTFNTGANLGAADCSHVASAQRPLVCEGSRQCEVRQTVADQAPDRLTPGTVRALAGRCPSAGRCR
jgi:hypothetical protein